MRLLCYPPLLTTNLERALWPQPQKKSSHDRARNSIGSKTQGQAPERGVRHRRRNQKANKSTHPTQ